MEITKFHKIRTAVQSNASPAAPHEIELLRQRLQDSLMATGLFDEVEVGETDDPDNLVIAMCRFPARARQAQVAQRLEQMWNDKLRYGFWEAHSLRVDADQVEFQGATRASSSGHYATLHIVAQKGVPEQRSR